MNLKDEEKRLFLGKHLRYHVDTLQPINTRHMLLFALHGQRWERESDLANGDSCQFEPAYQSG